MPRGGAARRRSPIAGVRGLLLTVVCEAAACQQRNPVPARAVTSDAMPDTTPAAAPAAAAAPPPATLEPWARWPMPNARLPGLPNPRSYDTQTDGVVIDRITGLMWQRRLADTFMTQQKAQRQCDDLTLAGHDDWRLPSRIELVTLLDTTRIQPSIDVDAFPGTPSDWFWTSSPAADDRAAAWYVYFYFGYPKTDEISNSFSVRCVRSTRMVAALPARYDIHAKEVRDIATGLRWQRAAAPKGVSFEAARAYCRRLDLLGEKHWRVPTLGELLTLIDERAAAPMIDRGAFPEAPAEPFWTSSGFANGGELAWYVRFDHGNALYGRLIEPFRVRCVL
jgi:Protein of unknown function (DUF1566)